MDKNSYFDIYMNNIKNEKIFFITRYYPIFNNLVQGGVLTLISYVNYIKRRANDTKA